MAQNPETLTQCSDFGQLEPSASQMHTMIFMPAGGEKHFFSLDGAQELLPTGEGVCPGRAGALYNEGSTAGSPACPVPTGCLESAAQFCAGVI